MFSLTRILIDRTLFNLMVALVGIIAPQAIFAAESAKALQQLAERANQEGKVVFISAGIAPEVLRELNLQFNKKFGVNIKVEGLPLSSSEAVTRLLQEKAAKRISMDILHPSYSLAFRLLGEGLLSDFDWIGVFAERLPGIREVATKVPAVLKNKGLDFQHLVYIPMYNTNLVSKGDVPKRWTDFLDPKWKGRKIVIDPRGTSLYLLFLEYGESWTLEFASRLVQQDPLFEKGAPAISRAVARGEAPLGITVLSDIIEQKHKKMPVEVLLPEVVAIVPQVLLPIEGSPNRNAAKLFSAWMSTEGLAIEEKADFSSRAWPGSGGAQARVLENTSVKILFASGPEEVEAAGQVLAKVQRIMQRQK
ncbi:MAG: extracellular solute-binding protein [Deltaproteobacteria bacterium]|nr:extracellular solute-binding protein [Deltaproteobacteria bacterium]